MSQNAFNRIVEDQNRDEALREHAKFERDTLCWSCSKPFPRFDAKCPNCGSTNANVDFETAQREMLA